MHSCVTSNAKLDKLLLGIRYTHAKNQVLKGNKNTYGKKYL